MTRPVLNPSESRRVGGAETKQQEPLWNHFGHIAAFVGMLTLGAPLQF